MVPRGILSTTTSALDQVKEGVDVGMGEVQCQAKSPMLLTFPLGPARPMPHSLCMICPPSVSKTGYTSGSEEYLNNSENVLTSTRIFQDSQPGKLDEQSHYMVNVGICKWCPTP